MEIEHHFWGCDPTLCACGWAAGGGQTKHKSRINHTVTVTGPLAGPLILHFKKLEYSIEKRI
jgi:hypothetical protein